MLSHQEISAAASYKVVKDSDNVSELEMDHCVAGEDEVILAVNSFQDLNKNKNQASNSAE